jgi:general secretion pathway protein I
MRHRRGFTLLEVLVAVAVLGLALVMLMGLLSRGLREVAEAEQRSVAAMYLQGLLDNAGRVARLRPGRSGGPLGDGRYRWQREVVAVPLPWAAPAGGPRAAGADGGEPGAAAEPQLLRVTVEVRWGDAPAQRMVASTLRTYYPAPVGP